jgi:hypothetical protein
MVAVALTAERNVIHTTIQYTVTCNTIQLTYQVWWSGKHSDTATNNTGT